MIPRFIGQARRIWRVLLPLLLFILLLSPSAGTVNAHGFIVRGVPEQRATLDRGPTRVQYWFSESLEPEFSSLNVRDQSGAIIASGGVDPTNPTLMAAQLPTNLPDGAYVVELRPAFASDGHVYAESRVFFIGPEIGGITGDSAASGALPLEVLWRAMLLIASMLLFGVVTLYTVVLLPAWGNPAYPAGGLPPRVMRRLNWLFALALIGVVIANIAALLQQTMVFFNTGLAEVISQNLWVIVRIGSRFGDVWTVRLLLLLLAGTSFAASLYYRERNPEYVRPFWIANSWVLALLVGSFSVVSHAAGSVMLPWIGMGVDWLHGVGVGFWVGGLAALTLVLPVALQPYSGDERRQVLLPALRRFSRVATGAMLLVVTTGIYSALTWVDTPDTLTASSFGLALLVKVGLVAGLIAVGAWHHLTANPEHFPRLRQRFSRLSQSPLAVLFTLRLESVLAGIVLIAAGVLTATPVPVPAYTQNQPSAPRATQIVNGYTITQTITPGGPGINTYDTYVVRDGNGVPNLRVQLQHVYPERDLFRPAVVADPVDTGVYAAADGALDRPGTWWTLVDLTAPDGTVTRAAFTFAINADAAVIQTQPPGVQHLLALLLVGAVLVWISLPLTRWIIARLDLSPTMVTVAVGATLATAFLMTVGYIMLQEADRAAQETANPPPAIVNSVLPDAESLARGETLFTAACAAWTAAPDVPLLRERILTASDNFLYTVITEGWRGLPGCAADLSPAQRWDVVNYVRAHYAG